MPAKTKTNKTNKTPRRKTGAVLKSAARKTKKLSTPKSYWNSRLTNSCGGSPLVECIVTPANISREGAARHSVKVGFVHITAEWHEASAADLREFAATIQQAANWFEEKQKAIANL
jgi:hypothetical protein